MTEPPEVRDPAEPTETPPGTETPDMRDPPDRWDRAAAWLMQRGALPALAVLTLGMAILYAGVFRGEVVGDDLSFHMAESARIADCLAAGDLDLWNPSANAGFASAYYYQVVPQLISAIPAAVFGHHLWFFQLSVFLPLVLAPAAAYRGMRLLGATPWQATLAGLAIGFFNGESRWGTGNVGTFSVGLYTQTWALAAFPIALGHAVRWATQSRSLAPAIAWGAFITLCHPFAGVSLAVALVAGWIGLAVLAGVERLLARLARRMLATRATALRSAALDRPVDRPAGHTQPSDAPSPSDASHPRNPAEPGPPRDPAEPSHAAHPRNTAEPSTAAAELSHAAHPRDPAEPSPPAHPRDPAEPGDASHLADPSNDPPSPGLAAVAKAWVAARWRDAPRPWIGTWLAEFGRLAILGGCLFIAWMPIWLPLELDYEGFGGFPHRVNDEVGPGFATLFHWYAFGSILDYSRPLVLTCLLPIVALFARPRSLRWLWAPAVAYALLLGVGPHMGKTEDDLIPAVRFLGALQVVLALAIGAGALWLARQIWDAPEGAALHRPIRGALRLAMPARRRDWARDVPLQYAVRTGLAALGAALGVLLILPGADALQSRVHVLSDYPDSHGGELHKIAQLLQREPPGRKQVGPGAESHWWNLLTYEYGRRPALLMMGGGGLQASPNYDFLWTVRDFPKHAWVYDAPILVFEKKSASKMPAAPQILETTHYEARRLPSPGLVSPVQVTGTLPPGKAAHAAAMTWLKGDQPLKDRVLAYDGSGGAGDEPHGRVVRSFRQDSPGDEPDLYAEVETTAPTTFMARESWHPRWHAYLDGAEVPVRRVTPDFPAVDVPAGHHGIALRFERPWWALAAWLAWVLVPLAAWRITRRRANYIDTPSNMT